jgi:carbamate kinase
MADMEHTQMVIALGGNAISRKGEEGNLAQQFARTRESCEFLADFVAAGHEIVITHGNGPQVGDALRRVELTASEIYPVPLHMCVADTQATMGFMISQCLSNALARRGIERTVSAVLTNVAVGPARPGFRQSRQADRQIPLARTGRGADRAPRLADAPIQPPRLAARCAFAQPARDS